MRYAGIIENDVVNGEGVCVSLFTQGCHQRCKGCFNKDTWSFDGGYEIAIDDLINKIANLITKNGIQRNFSILGGEPLCRENINDVAKIITSIKDMFPDIKIFLWTGYIIEDMPINNAFSIIKSKVDYIIDGPYIEKERDLTLKWRGSRNQRILTKKIL